jgi:hypothetical protein
MRNGARRIRAVLSAPTRIQLIALQSCGGQVAYVQMRLGGIPSAVQPVDEKAVYQAQSIRLQSRDNE